MAPSFSCLICSRPSNKQTPSSQPCWERKEKTLKAGPTEKRKVFFLLTPRLGCVAQVSPTDWQQLSFCLSRQANRDVTGLWFILSRPYGRRAFVVVHPYSDHMNDSVSLSSLRLCSPQGQIMALVSWRRDSFSKCASQWSSVFHEVLWRMSADHSVIHLTWPCADEVTSWASCAVSMSCANHWYTQFLVFSSHK